eukprot:GHVT01070326.1.p1 GENE.GHVT01070326.1~~GHVT01070326.1.p1  ORF type:complete len:317 (-),score=57.56 GHVT01070326.1:1316-2266(-)
MGSDFLFLCRCFAVIASPIHAELPHVPVLVAGDASVRYRYIHPALLAVIVKDLQNSSSSSLPASYSVLLLNSVTGTIAYQETFPPGTSPPFHLVVCENFLLVHFWQSLASRYELRLVEFYDSKPDQGPWQLMMSAMFSNVPSLSAYDLKAPVAMQRSFIFPHALRAITVTATAKGITPRAFIMSLGSAQIYQLSTRLLNGRRPFPNRTTSVADGEDGLMPYLATIPLAPQDFVSVQRQVQHVRGICNFPAHLESTSNCFVYGLDLFFAPVQPAKGYDALSSTFNFGLLTAAFGVLLTVAIWTGRRAGGAYLMQDWK